MVSIFRRLALGLALLLLGQSMPAFAWWEYGHATVADIALANVKPKTRAAVLSLVAKQGLLDTPTCPVQNIGEAAAWADCVKERPTKDRFSFMDNWHYQNVDVCKPFDLKAACANGNCVSAQIERQFRLLKDRSLPQREQVMALFLLVHFVGDLHQPLHAGDHSDAGGNGTRTDYGIVPYPRLNLHRVWDGYLAERAITSGPSLVRVWPAAERERLAAGTVTDWSREGWEIGGTTTYPAALGPDHCNAPKGKRGTLSEATIESLLPVTRDQITKGGLRLARLLDEALGA
jgi:hypothetical protein